MKLIKMQKYFAAVLKQIFQVSTLCLGIFFNFFILLAFTTFARKHLTVAFLL